MRVPAPEEFYAKPRNMMRVFCHEMTLFDMFGGRYKLSYTEVLKLLTHWNTVCFCALVAFGLSLIDPHHYRGHMPFFGQLFIWQAAAFAVILSRLAFTSLASIITFYLPKIVLPGFLFAIIDFTWIFFAMDWLSMFWLADSYSTEILKLYPYLLLTMLLVDLSFVRLLLPKLLTEIRNDMVPPADNQQSTKETPAPTAGIRTVELGGRVFPLDRIQWIRSQEHYLEITTTNSQTMVRAQLTAFEDQVSDYDGVRCHRSWWISRNTDARLDRVDGKPVVNLGDGTVAPISRSRLSDVQSWFDLHMI